VNGESFTICWKLEEHASIILEGYVGLGREVKYQSSGFADGYVKFAGDKSTVTKKWELIMKHLTPLPEDYGY